MGGTAAVIDLADSSQNDLGKHSCWNDVDKNLHAFDVVGIDMPCNTWSRARRAPWWSRMPKPLRKAGEYIFGLPWLSELDRIKVNKANIMLKRAVKVIRKCLKLGKSGYLENPMSSMIWQTPQIQRLLRDSRVKLCPLEMCMYNTQWKKPTFILLWNAPATNFLRWYWTTCVYQNWKITHAVNWNFWQTFSYRASPSLLQRIFESLDADFFA